MSQDAPGCLKCLRQFGGATSSIAGTPPETSSSSSRAARIAVVSIAVLNIVERCHLHSTLDVVPL